MFSLLDSLKLRLRNWLIAHAHGRSTKAWLAFISFSESSFFPIPTVAFLVSILMAGAKKWLYYATFTTLFSVAGGVFGYVVGAFFFDTVGSRIVDFYNLGADMEHVRTLYDRNAFWVVFIGAFTPLPFKVFTLSAGFLKINVLVFLLASLVGRALQFYVVAYIVKLFGEHVARILYKYFTVVTITLVLFVGIILLL